VWWLIVLAETLAPLGVRVVQSQSSGISAAEHAAIAAFLKQVHARDSTWQEVKALLEANFPYTFTVADFEGTFELALAQVHWGRDSGAAAGTDDAVTTHHFLKLTAGAPAVAAIPADLTAVEDAFETFWTGVKDNYPDSITLKQVRWYKAGPDITPPQPPTRTHSFDLPGTITGGIQTPPQVALSVTEKTSDPNSWGRFYLPCGVWATVGDVNGRFLQAFLDDVGTGYSTFHTNCVTASMHPVVYSAAKPVRQTAADRRAGVTPGSLPAVDARALAITNYQIDDIPDVIRSRRWNEPLIRDQNLVTA